MSVMLVFKDHEGDNFMLSFPAAENDVPMKLKLWVAYERAEPVTAHFSVSKEDTTCMCQLRKPAAWRG